MRVIFERIRRLLNARLEYSLRRSFESTPTVFQQQQAAASFLPNRNFVIHRSRSTIVLAWPAIPLKPRRGSSKNGSGRRAPKRQSVFFVGRFSLWQKGPTKAVNINLSTFNLLTMGLLDSLENERMLFVTPLTPHKFAFVREFWIKAPKTICHLMATC